MTTAREMMTTWTCCVHAGDTVQRPAHLMTEWGMDVLPVCGQRQPPARDTYRRDIVLKTLGASKEPPPPPPPAATNSSTTGNCSPSVPTATTWATRRRG